VKNANAGFVLERGTRMLLQKLFVSSPRPTAGGDPGQNGRKFIEENLSWPLLVDSWFHDLNRPDTLERNTTTTSIGGGQVVNPTLALEVPFLDLKAQYRALAPEIDRAVASVLESAQFVGGPFVENLNMNLPPTSGRSTPLEFPQEHPPWNSH